MVESIRRALRPTFRATCLTQAMAGWIMLSRRHIPAEVKIGVLDPAVDRFGAHAWLEADRRVLLGDIGLEPFNVVWTLGDPNQECLE